jgi:hypothetical protein
MDYKKIGIGLSSLGVVAGAVFFLTREAPEIEAIVTCPGDGPVETVNGFVNIEDLELGEVRWLADGKMQKVGELSFPQGVVPKPTPNARMSTQISGDFETTFTGDVSEQIRAEVAKRLRANSSVTIENYYRLSVGMSDVLAAANTEEFKQELILVGDGRHTLKLEVVTEVFRGDRISADLVKSAQIEGAGDLAELGVEGIRARVSEECVNLLHKETTDGLLLYRTTPMFYDPIASEVTKKKKKKKKE